MALLSSAAIEAKADVPFVVDAIAKAKEEPTAEGRWVVTATVVFTSDKNGGMVATGPIAFAPFPTNGLKGVIPMTIGDDAATSKINALGLVVKPDGTVGIQWLIEGKPFLGRPTMVFEASAFPDYLSKRINFGGAARRMKLTLSTEQIKPPRIRVPGSGTNSEVKSGTPEDKKLIGKRYKVTGRMEVTDASDGLFDNTCEMEGILVYSRGANIKGRYTTDNKEYPLVTIISQAAGKNFRLDFNNNILLDHIFDKPETEYFQVRSSIWDHDGATDYEVMSVDKSRARTLSDLARITAKSGEWNLPGDRDSENIEVYYSVTFVKDLYEGDVK